MRRHKCKKEDDKCKKKCKEDGGEGRPLMAVRTYAQGDSKGGPGTPLLVAQRI
jgi:hypothetical protein